MIVANGTSWRMRNCSEALPIAPAMGVAASFAGRLLATLIAFAAAGCASPHPEAGRNQPFTIVERPRIECLVNRGTYCIPDMGLYVAVYSSDEEFATILKIGDRITHSGYGYVIERGTCNAPASRPRMITRSERLNFEGESWSVARFILNQDGCEISVLFESLEEQPDGNSFEEMITG